MARSQKFSKSTLVRGQICNEVASDNYVNKEEEERDMTEAVNPMEAAREYTDNAVRNVERLQENVNKLRDALTSMLSTVRAADAENARLKAIIDQKDQALTDAVQRIAGLEGEVQKQKSLVEAAASLGQAAVTNADELQSRATSAEEKLVSMVETMERLLEIQYK